MGHLDNTAPLWRGAQSPRLSPADETVGRRATSAAVGSLAAVGGETAVRRTRMRAAVLIVATAGGVALMPAAADAAVRAQVSWGVSLNMRTGPSTTYSTVGRIAAGRAIVVACQSAGERIAGSLRTTNLWDRLSNGRYISDAYVNWGRRRPAVPWCTAVARAAIGTNLRANASVLRARTGWVPAGGWLSVACQLGGEYVSGRMRNTALWDRLSDGRFISDANVMWPGPRPAIRWCVTSSVIAPPAGSRFVTWAAPYARTSMARYRVPASVTIAQSILESGWGTSALTRDGNAFFGMKCFGSPNRIALGCRNYRTTECSTSSCYSTSASFRVYHSVWASFADHGKQLATLPRYRNAFRYVTNPNRFAVEVHRAGYATGPTYASNLISIMRRYNLYRFDRGVLS